jgi:hypothetical protein
LARHVEEPAMLRGTSGLGDIEAFPHDPGDILEQFRERLLHQYGERQHQQKELDALRVRLKEKSTERERMRGRFNAAGSTRPLQISAWT